METKLTENERTAMSQNVTRQPDGPGLRIGKRGELSGIGKLTPDGARLFRERKAQFQAEAAFWEKEVGTVHDFRMWLLDNDTKIMFSIVYDGDFKPYVEDLIMKATPWMDQIFLGVWEGYKGFKDPGLAAFVLDAAITADFFYAAYPNTTRRDIEKMQRLSNAVGEMLDAAG